MSERNDRKVYVGKVISNRMDKTIIVLVETYRTYKLYGKRMRYSKKYKTHDENNSVESGDIVKIQETRSLLVTKRSRLVKIVEEPVTT